MRICLVVAIVVFCLGLAAQAGAQEVQTGPDVVEVVKPLRRANLVRFLRTGTSCGPLLHLFVGPDMSLPGTLLFAKVPVGDPNASVTSRTLRRDQVRPVVMEIPEPMLIRIWKNGEEEEEQRWELWITAQDLARATCLGSNAAPAH